MYLERLPSAKDHCHIQVLVHIVGSPGTGLAQNRVFERIRRIKSVSVSSSENASPRTVLVHYLSSYTPLWNAWGELQVHRRILGLVVIGFLRNGTDSSAGTRSSRSSSVRSGNDVPLGDEGSSSDGQNSDDKNSSDLGPTTTSLNDVLDAYKSIRNDYRSTLYDSRCFVFGEVDSTLEPSSPVTPMASASEFANVKNGSGMGENLLANGCEDFGENGETEPIFMVSGSGRERVPTIRSQTLITFPSLEQSSDLEIRLHEFIESLFWILESKRLDKSFERAENLTCPSAPEEDKARVGLEDKTSKNYKRRCVGRYRKQQADYCLLAGLPTCAHEAYKDAIDRLKSVNDMLWLAAAYEGLACTAMIMRYAQELQNPGLHRVATFTPGELRKFGDGTKKLPFRGHSRNSSLDGRLAVKDLPSSDEIIAYFVLGLENYRRFSFAAFVELECVFKAARVYLYEKSFNGLNDFLITATEKYLSPDSNLMMDSTTRAFIYHMVATIFKECGFYRKAAFFLRITATCCLTLNAAESGEPSAADYKRIYPMLLLSLEGCKLPLSSKHETYGVPSGWPAVQLRSLQEVYKAALRAGLTHVAVRHLSYMLQLLHGDMSTDQFSAFSSELQRLCQETLPSTTHIQLTGGTVLPPVSFTWLPLVILFNVLPLPEYLKPLLIKRSEYDPADDFIFTNIRFIPDDKTIRWVCGLASEVVLRLQNPVDVELQLDNFAIMYENGSCEAVPVTINLLPSQTLDVRLLAIPRSSGMLSITGYSFELFGVPNICRLRDCPFVGTDAVRVLVTSPLPVLQIQSTFPRCSDPEPKDPLELANAEVHMYSGQSSDGVIVLTNNSAHTIDHLDVTVDQPKAESNTSLLEIVDGGDCSPSLPLSRGNSHMIKVRLNAVNLFTSTDVGRTLPTSFDFDHEPAPLPSRSHCVKVKVRYSSDEAHCHNFQRLCSFLVTITTKPLILIRDLSVLTGGSIDTRYLTLDIANLSEETVDVEYRPCGEDQGVKTMPMETAEGCRLPIPFRCCSRSAVTGFIQGMLQDEQTPLNIVHPLIKACREHLRRELDIRWRIKSKDTWGVIPVWRLLSSVDMCKDMIYPPLSCRVTIDDHSDSDPDSILHNCQSGRPVCCRVEIINPSDLPYKSCEVRLICSLALEGKTPSRADARNLCHIFGPTLFSFTLGPHGRQVMVFSLLFSCHGLFEVDLLCLLTSQLAHHNSTFNLTPPIQFNVQQPTTDTSSDIEEIVVAVQHNVEL